MAKDRITFLTEEREQILNTLRRCRWVSQPSPVQPIPKPPLPRELLRPQLGLDTIGQPKVKKPK